jgi:ubiquinone/menaquinone biosynthesis C-methylase UbiE
MHHDIALRTAELAISLDGAPHRVLDVGCGTGLLLRLLAQRLPGSDELVGVDAAPGMVDVATSMRNDPRLRFSAGVAEDLPFPEASFDLVVSTTSFDHWEDQRRGLTECARVLSPGGHLVLTDLFSLWLVPTLLVGHRGHARTKHLAGDLLKASGFHNVSWRRLYALILSTAVASK